MSHLYLDIETVPGPLPLEVVAELIANRQERDPARYAATCPWLCQIVCIGMAFDDEEPIAVTELIAFWRRLRAFQVASGPIQLVTFNGADFDVPALVHAWAKSGLNCGRFETQREVPDAGDYGHIAAPSEEQSLAEAYWGVFGLKDEKPWAAAHSRGHLDLMEVMRHGTRRRVGFREACLAYGVADPKGGCDGSQVADLVAQGRLEDVYAYCRRDVAALRALHKRLVAGGLV